MTEWLPTVVVVLLLLIALLLFIIAYGVFSLIGIVNLWRLDWGSNPREATEKQMNDAIEHLKILSDEVERRDRRELRERYDL
ncbi:MAG: hypothetical protein KF835_00295 [Xanthobacteraceae bacterium]|nr:hypothetical protein [Xanthobacteraceae bacterium]